MMVTYVYVLSAADVAWVNEWNKDLAKGNVVINERGGVFYVLAKGLDDNSALFQEVVDYISSNGIQKKLMEIL